MKQLLLPAAVLLLALLTADPRWRPFALGGAFLLRIGIPSAVSSATVFAGLHVTSLLVFAYALIWPLAAPKVESNAENRTPHIPFLCHATLVAVAAGSVMMSETSSAALYTGALTMNQLVAPYVFCMLIYGTSRYNQSLFKNAGKFFALVCVFEALIAIAVSSHILPQPFQSSFATYSWWNSVSASARELATLDHPLSLGLLLAAGLPMVAYFESSIMAIFSAGVMVVGIGLTESRIAAAMAVMGTIYLLVFTIRSNMRRLGAITVGGVIFVTALNFGIFSNLIDKVGNDRGSSLARTRSWTLFLDSWNDFGTVGIGMESSRDYFLQHGLRASGESAAVAYSVGIGIPLTVLYFSLMVWLIGYGVRKSNRLTPASVAAIGAFISIQLFSSISTESAVGMILWATIGISLATPRMAPIDVVQDGKPDRVSGTVLHRSFPTVRSSAVRASSARS